jgi:hypothetical protein
MTSFAVRVEVNVNTFKPHKGYNDVHDALKGLGLLKTISADNGTTYKLPGGEYYGSSPKTSE